MSPCLLLGMAPGTCCGGTLGSGYSGCRPPGESMLSPGPGGEEPEEGQVHGLRGASATSSRPTSSADGDMEPRTLCFYFKANGRAFAQELPRPSPRRISCPSHLFPPGPEGWASGLGRTGSIIPSRGQGHRGFLSRADLRYFHLGKGFQGSPEALPALFWVFPWQVCLCSDQSVLWMWDGGMEPGCALL